MAQEVAGSKPVTHPTCRLTEWVSCLPSIGAIRLRKTVEPSMRLVSDDPLLRAFFR